MAGGNFLGRTISYLVNELLVESLANNTSFQRFAVRTSNSMKNLTSKIEQAKQEVVEQLKGMDNKGR